MAVNLKTVKDTVNLAAGVLAAAAGVVDGAKQLGFDVDGAVKSAADGATNGARAVADGIGKGFGAAAEASARQPARWGMPRSVPGLKGRRGGSQEDRCRQAINI